MKLINNKDILLIDELKSIINEESNLYIAADFFTVFGMYELLEVVSKVKQIKVLLSISQENIEHFNLLQTSEESIKNLDLDRKYRIAKVTELLENKIEIREGGMGGQKIIIVENKGTTICFSITPRHLDLITLGNIPSSMPIVMTEIEDENHQFLNLFNQNWENATAVLTDKVLQHYKLGTKNYTGEAIYKYAIREIFQYATINERADEKLKKTGFKNTKIWNLLYNFQKDAVIGAIEKIETYGGCIIADSVGLGKTFEALAVMKYYELRNDRVLVLAPKKLRENWTLYRLNDKQNILAEDRLNYDVLNHTDLTRKRGKSGDIDLESINWGNYDLVVIDESHNFRNNPNKRDGMTRYKRLMNDIIRANIKTRVLMLSATPVNNRMNDLKNQIAFITEGNDEAFLSYGIESITQVMKDAQRKFTQWYKNSDPDELSVNDLMTKLGGSYFRILDMLTIARSRKHIEKYYDTTDIGKFPERLTPITLSPPIDTKGKFQNIGDLYDNISRFTLASYAPLVYLADSKKASYEEKYDMKTSTGSVFKQVDRELNLIYLMRVNLLKRLESSIHSFKLTLAKLLNLVEGNLEQIERHKNGEVNNNLNITEIDIDDTELEDFLVGGKTKVLLQDMDLIRWKQDLQHDQSVLIQLMANVELITAERDAKLKELKNKIVEKIQCPINKDNKKIIVFTAFADTATYLYRELSSWLKDEHHLYSALVTGANTNKTNMPKCRADLNTILTHFSPQSKHRKDVFPNEKNQIDVLICTDCISEGQNLQDCDYLINYDIHWNPVRIIQRFGRIDRIGSTNEQIQLVNFFPNMELDNFIDLIARVQGRMVMLDVSATGEDNIISKESKEMQDLEYRKRQLKQLQNQVMDLEDVQGNISITDLTFNDFKIDLEKSTDEQLEELKTIPPASFAVVKANLEQIKEGIIFCLKDTTQASEVKLKNNLLYPFFLVYKSLDGTEEVKVTQAKLALDYFRKLGMGNDKVLPELIQVFEQETKSNKKMYTYTQLLQDSLKEINQVQEEIGLDSLATAGGTHLVANTLAEHSLELVSYLIIK